MTPNESASFFSAQFLKLKLRILSGNRCPGPGKGVLDLVVGLLGLEAEVAELNRGYVWRVEGVKWSLEVANRDELASFRRSTGLTTLERLLG